MRVEFFLRIFAVTLKNLILPVQMLKAQLTAHEAGYLDAVLDYGADINRKDEPHPFEQKAGLFLSINVL